MRLVDADAISYKRDIAVTERLPKFGGFNGKIVYSVTKEEIDAMPTVDAVPVVHGRWIRVYSRPGVFKYLGWTCDQCGQRTGNEYAPQWYKFCPNCGARMDGKDSEQHD